MTCLRLRQGLVSGLPIEELLEHVETCHDCQFYLENSVNVRGLAIPSPPNLAASLGISSLRLSCEEALKVLVEEEFQDGGGAARHLDGCGPCRETADAFQTFVDVARGIRMPVRLRHRLEGVTEEPGVSLFGRILPYAAAFLLATSLTLFFASKGNLSREVVRLQEKVLETKGTAASAYGRIVGYFARNLDKEDANHEMRKSSRN